MPDKTKRPEADKAKHQYTTLLPETIAMIQMKIVELEVSIRLKENECDFLAESIEVMTKELNETNEKVQKEYYSSEISKNNDLLEKAEIECDRLERTQLYYKQQLDSGSTLPVY